jgi:antitoxin component of MazEF toxin-antitoxin module
MFISKVRRVGNSQSVLVPATVARSLGINEGDEVEVEVRPIGRVSFDTALADCFDDYGPVLEALADR